MAYFPPFKDQHLHVLAYPTGPKPFTHSFIFHKTLYHLYLISRNPLPYLYVSLISRNPLPFCIDCGSRLHKPLEVTFTVWHSRTLYRDIATPCQTTRDYGWIGCVRCFAQLLLVSILYSITCWIIKSVLQSCVCLKLKTRATNSHSLVVKLTTILLWHSSIYQCHTHILV